MVVDKGWRVMKMGNYCSVGIMCFFFYHSEVFLEVSQQVSLPTSLATILTACSLTRGIEQG